MYVNVNLGLTSYFIVIGPCLLHGKINENAIMQYLFNKRIYRTKLYTRHMLMLILMLILV